MTTRSNFKLAVTRLFLAILLLLVASCSSSPTPEETFVKLRSGSVVLRFPNELGGEEIRIEGGLFGSYTRRWSGDSFTVDRVWLSLPSITLPLEGGRQTGPIILQGAIGDFPDEMVAEYGSADQGRFRPDEGVLEETLGLEADFPLLNELDDGYVRILFSKREEGYNSATGASLSWTGTGIVTEGFLRGATIGATSRLGKGHDYHFPICKPRRISTGFGTFATSCSVVPAGTATCTVSNLGGAGGVLVHCTAAGVATVTINYQDGGGTARTATKTVHCQ